MFEDEATGLKLLRHESEFTIPEVFGIVNLDGDSFFFMEMIEPATAKPSFWIDFGTNLAEMHEHTHSAFGLDTDNYIGSLAQSNTQGESWIEFFAEQRLRPLIKQAVDIGFLESSDLLSFDKLERSLNDFFPEERPSLLHGDLWSGNYLVGKEGEPVLIDPAVYYGHRYMDLGMMKLFGGFDSRAMESYNEKYLLESNWSEGIEIANLYPLLVHVVLFGGGYLGSVRSILRSFV